MKLIEKKAMAENDSWKTYQDEITKALEVLVLYQG
jgi:hypothetical protein